MPHLSPSRAVAVALLVAVDVGASALDGTWSEAMGPFLSPRYFHTSVFDPHGRRIIVYGGSGQIGGRADSIPWSYSIDEGRWRALLATGNAPPPRWTHSAIFDPLRDRMIVYGGGGMPNEEFLNDVWALNLTGAPAWTQLALDAQPPPPLYGRLAVYDALGDRLIVVGGLPGGPFGEVWSFDLNGDSGWEALTVIGTPPPARVYASAIYDAARARIVLFAGIWGVPNAETWELTLGATPEWRLLATGGAPPPRHAHTAIYDPVADRMIVFGGFSGSAMLNDCWSLSLAGMGWVEIEPGGVLPKPRGSHAAVFDPVSGQMFALFGLDASSQRLADVPVLDLSTAASWIPNDRAVADVPGVGALHGAVEDPASGRMLVFGGQFGVWTAGCPRQDHIQYHYSSAVGALSLGTRASWPWLATSGTPPAGRMAHSLVYDTARRRLLVFGGVRFLFDYCDPHSGYSRYRWESLDDLWELRLDPSPVWNLLAPQGPGPGPRGFHATIYDPLRDRLIVSGGKDPVTGTRYSETWSLSLGDASQWSLLTTSGSPPMLGSELRSVYDPVRDRMVVFGSSDRRITTLSLDATPAWSEILPNGGPVPDLRGASVCYDERRDRVVVFGGYESTPTSNLWALTLGPGGTWSALAPAGAPPPTRYNHSAVYQAEHDRMIIFAGNPPSGVRVASGREDTWVLTWDSPTATTASLVSAGATPHEVVLTWWVSAAPGSSFDVSRRLDGDDWVSVAQVSPDGSGKIRFEDHDVTPGMHVRYRLGDRTTGVVQSLQEVDVDIPLVLKLALEGVRPNPTADAALIVATLPDSRPATLQVLDPAGRVLESRAIGNLGPCRCWIPTDTGSLPAGVYFARLVVGKESRSAKFLIVR